MKRERKVLDARRKFVLKYIMQNNNVTLDEIASKLNVSKATINRDLNILQQGGYISRKYGQISILKLTDLTSGKTDEKEQIAKYAATLIEDNDVIFINSSYTALSILKYVTDKRVTVITNNANALYSPHSHLIRIILTGGELRELKGVMLGDFAINNLKRVSVQKCFVGCCGLSVKSGFTTDNFYEVNINELMLTKTIKDAYVLADYTKIGKAGSFTSAPISSIFNVITNENAPTDEIQKFKDLNINVLLAPNE